MKYKFNKNIFRVWLALVLILLSVVLINYVDYEEYKVNCEQTQCTYNKTFFKEYYILEDNLRQDRQNDLNFTFSSEGTLYSGEYIIFSNYETKPTLIDLFFNITIGTLMLAFLLNHFVGSKILQVKK